MKLVERLVKCQSSKIIEFNFRFVFSMFMDAGSILEFNYESYLHKYFLDADILFLFHAYAT